MIYKTITIKDQHQRWIKENSINLSRFVQKQIDEAMEDMERFKEFAHKSIDEATGDQDHAGDL
jgi:hypothetical protein